MSEYGIVFPDFKKKPYALPQTYIIEGTTENWSPMQYVGIDPGVNFGITLIHGNKVEVIWGRLPKTKEKGIYGYHAYNYIEGILIETYRKDIPVHAVIEGAAYRAFGNQVVLEEVRIGFYLAMVHMGMIVKIVPPATIRKSVSGSGLTQAGDVWPLLKHDAADSIFCALHARTL